jgi:hypothetical protein
MLGDTVREFNMFEFLGAVFPVHEVVARAAKCNQILKIVVLSIAIFVVHTQRSESLFSTLFTLNTSESFNCDSKTSDSVLIMSHCLINEGGTFSGTEPFLSTLERLTPQNDRATTKARAALSTSNRTKGALFQVKFVNSVHLVTRRALAFSPRTLESTRFRAEDLSLSGSSIMSFELCRTNRTHIHADTSNKGTHMENNTFPS